MCGSFAGKGSAGALLLACLIASGCGTVPCVRPVGQGNRSVSLSSGGPITKIHGITMPVPYAVARVRYGLDEKTDLHAGIHPTMLLLGNLGADAGMTKQVVTQSGARPAVSVEGSIYAFYNGNELSSIRAYPEASILVSHDLGSGTKILYTGLQNMFQGARPYAVSVPLAGFGLDVFGRFAVCLEGKWYAPLERSTDRAVDYSFTPFEHGVLGLAFGGSYEF